MNVLLVPNEDNLRVDLHITDIWDKLLQIWKLGCSAGKIMKKYRHALS